MKFSVITVCLNSERTIEKTIESVLNQQGIELEYIIIDGCSTDQTVEIIKKYESRIAYWCSEPDGGIYEAMNKGIAAATGDVISFMNSTDWYADGALLCVQQKMLDGDYDIVCGKVAHVRNGVVVETSSKPEDETELYYKMFCHQGIFTKRTVFTQFGDFDLQYRICADHDWLLRVYNQGVHIAYIDTVTSYFSLGGVSSGFGTVQERKAVCLKHLPLDLYDKYYSRIMERYDRGVLWHKYYHAFEYMQRDLHLAEEVKATLFIGNTCSLFGTGRVAHECHKLFQTLNIELGHIYDNDRNKQGKKFLNVEVKSPDRIKPDETIVIGTTIYANEIKKQLANQQVTRVIEFVDIMKIVVSQTEIISGRTIDLEVNGDV